MSHDTQNPNNTDVQESNLNFERGLPMVSKWAPELLEQEKQELQGLSTKGLVQRWKGYFSKTGPGWLQSAMTLGSGSAMASLYAGAYLQYSLLWVQPLAMLMGIIMLSAMAHQTLSTGARPFSAMKRHVSPGLAWAWALATLVSTVIWHFPQYALAAGMTEDMVKAITGWTPSPGAQTVFLVFIGVLCLVISTLITWSYGSGARGIRLYERTLKLLVWMVIVAFAAVVMRNAKTIQWGKVFKGFIPLNIPRDPRGISVVMGALGAAVGINMTFLFPYTLLARGWGREHRGLAKFDLLSGMFLPYAIATSLMIVAAGCTIYQPGAFSSGATILSPVKAASMLETAGLGTFWARIVFGLGILGMALSTITLHMLVSGFAACEIFGIEPEGWRYKLACLIPAPGVLGVVLWKYMGSWIAVPTSAICGLLLPIAYIGFFLLNNRRRYLGKDTPSGPKALTWNIAMIVSIAIVIASSLYYLYSKRGWFGLG